MIYTHTGLSPFYKALINSSCQATSVLEGVFETVYQRRVFLLHVNFKG